MVSYKALNTVLKSKCDGINRTFMELKQNKIKGIKGDEEY